MRLSGFNLHRGAPHAPRAQVHHLTERLIEMEQRLEREADARRKIQARHAVAADTDEFVGVKMRFLESETFRENPRRFTTETGGDAH